MRKYICLFTAMALATLALVSCSESKLRQLVDNANADCPQSLGLIGEITSVELKDGQVIISYTVSEEYADFDALNAAGPELIKKNALVLLKNQNDDILAVMNQLYNENAGLVMQFTSEESDEVFTLTFTPEDIAAVATSGDEVKSQDDVLKAHAELANTQCPMEVEKGVTLTYATVEDAYYVYNFMVDEEVYSIESLNANKEKAKEEIIKAMDVGNPAVRLVVMMCEKADKGIAFRYSAVDNDEECLVIVDTDEIRLMMEEADDEVAGEEAEDIDETLESEQEEEEENE